MQSLGAESRDLQPASSIAVSDSKFKPKTAGPGNVWLIWPSEFQMKCKGS